MRYRAVVEYDGTDYRGFQKQRNERTVQQELERAIKVISEKEVAVIGAGRTDSGVHALGQVIAFELEWLHDSQALQRALNATLSPDVAIVQLGETRDDFHPRFDAKRREYRYYIYNDLVRSPIFRRTSWHVSHLLDIERMNMAAQVLIGEHDFGTFGRPPHGENTIRQVYRANWARNEKFIIFSIEANAFLHRMVRCLVGSMKAVGEGSWTLEEFVLAMEASDRNRVAQLAPPHALFLSSVHYE